MVADKKKVLIIEDDEILSDLYVTKLKKEGYDVTLAQEGVSGIDEAIKKKPDLILLDIVLPKLNGFEILKQMKERDDIKDIPVVVMSNLGQGYEVEQGVKLGAVKYLIKSDYTPAQVIEEVKKQLG